MRMGSERSSANVEDRRGQRLGGAPMKLGLGGLALVVVVGLLTGQNPLSLLGQILSTQVNTESPAPGPLPDETAEPGQPGQTGAPDPQAEFVSKVLASTEDTWTGVFRSAGKAYEEPKLVLFSDAVRSACGFSSAAVGPFYCPADHKVYLDLSFFRELDRRFGAPGDFAQAYVVAHEIGHHVQTLLGISERMQSERARLGQEAANALSVRQELQADCLAGVWAHHAQKKAPILEEGDIEEGLGAASAIGDDRLQKQSQGYVAPESFTHGSSAQRVRWFEQGFKQGEIKGCDTFSSNHL